MRVQRLSIQSYRAFDELELSFVNEAVGVAYPIVALTGINGSGKTTVLECIGNALRLPFAVNLGIPARDRRREQPEAHYEVEVGLTPDELTLANRRILEVRPDLANRTDVVLPTQPPPSTFVSRGSTRAVGQRLNQLTGAFADQHYFQLWSGLAASRPAGYWCAELIPFDRVEPRVNVTQIKRASASTGALKQHLVDLDYLRLSRAVPTPFTPSSIATSLIRPRADLDQRQRQTSHP